MAKHLRRKRRGKEGKKEERAKILQEEVGSKRGKILKEEKEEEGRREEKNRWEVKGKEKCRKYMRKKERR